MPGPVKYLRDEIMMAALPEVIRIADDPHGTYDIVQTAYFVADVAMALREEPVDTAWIKGYVAEHRKRLRRG